ncbi:tight junction protein ZO-3 [Bifidobacterium platyrrhinorum]|uniref:Tight junction protein ZO-3 n=1 Tax=Bifidobacterium platyrrhinorum TaxID=2661628 RepID=A0A6L9SS54_9BIFI|nr:tight junction protein ZO-3 [Bifidobacterium platyrrhinorum]NEG55417.1 tight junction protein ZO-3 [Bifidobacterium platyrrhinorum]
MRIRKPFTDWTVESSIGLLAIITIIITGALIAGIIGLCAYELSHPEPVMPKQTVSQYLDKQGDVKRLCLVYKTGDHVDALSCDLVDDITGGVK